MKQLTTIKNYFTGGKTPWLWVFSFWRVSQWLVGDALGISVSFLVFLTNVLFLGISVSFLVNVRCLGGVGRVRGGHLVD